MGPRIGILINSFNKTVLRRQSFKKCPDSSTVLRAYLSHRDFPDWTAFYVPYSQTENDLFGRSHFNFSVSTSGDVSSGANYHVLRTGAFPFVKFHCTKRPVQDLTLEDRFYLALKVLNFGLPTLVYGLAGLAWAKHTECITVDDQQVTLFFWYKEKGN